MPVTGPSSSATSARFGAGCGLLAVGERDPGLDVAHAADAIGAPARRDAHAGGHRVLRARVDHVHPRGVGAVGTDHRERERVIEHVLVGPGLFDPRPRLHRAGRPDLDEVADGIARDRVVLGRRHEHATVGDAHALDATVAQRREEAPDHGPDGARVTARILERVVGDEGLGHDIGRIRMRFTVSSALSRSRARGLPSRGRAACASGACRSARAAALRRSRSSGAT